MKVGVDYYPEQWDKSLWEADADKMKEAGVRIVRMAEFAWSRMEPVEGEYDFTWLDEVMDMFEERGIEIVLGTPTNCPPLWLYEKYPEAVQVGRDGRRIALGVRGHRCYNSPIFRQKAEQMITVMAEHYKDRKGLVAWQSDNELEANFCCCEYCSQAFRDWLKSKYKSLTAVNAAYGNVMWAGEYSSWEQIKPPFGDYQLAWYNPGYMLDFHRYASDSTVRYLEFQREILRRYFPQTPITTNGWLCENMPGFYDLYKNLDFVSYDNYPVTSYREGEENYDSHAFHLDLMRGIKQKNFWIMEQLSGALGSWTPMSETPRPGMLAGYSLQAFAHGADTILHFRWRSATKGAEMHWHGIIDHSNVEGRRYREFADLCERADSLQEISGAVTKARVAVLYSTEAEYAFKIQPQYQGFHYFNQLKAYHEAFMSMGLNVDIIDWRGELSDYDIVVAPTLYMVDEEVTAALYAFVGQGGSLLLTGRSGVKDENNACIMQELPTVYRRLAGAHVKEYDAIGYKEQHIMMEDHDKDKVSYTIQGWCDLLETDTAEVLATYQDAFYAGTAAITRNRYGDGMVYYVGVVGKKMLYHELARMMLEEKNIPYIKDLPHGVEISYRMKDDKEYIFIFNNTDKGQKITLPFAVASNETYIAAGEKIALLPIQMWIGVKSSQN